MAEEKKHITIEIKPDTSIKGLERAANSLIMDTQVMILIDCGQDPVDENLGYFENLLKRLEGRGYDTQELRSEMKNIRENAKPIGIDAYEDMQRGHGPLAGMGVYQ